MMDIMQPIINTAILALVGFFVGWIIRKASPLVQPAKDWLLANTTDKQRQSLHRIAAEAVALFEVTIGSRQGQEKLRLAKDYVNRGLGSLGSNLSDTDIRAAVEKALAEYKAQQKGLDVNEHHQTRS